MVVGTRPDVDHFVIALTVGDQSRRILLLDLLYLGLRQIQNAGLLLGNHHVVDAERNARAGRVAKTHVHELVGENHSLLKANLPITGVDNAGDGLLVHGPVDQIERKPLGHDLGEQRASDSGLQGAAPLGIVTILSVQGFGNAHPDLGVQIHNLVLIGAVDFRDVTKEHAFTASIDALTGHVIQAKHHILGGHNDGIAVGRRQNVVGSHHQGASLQLSFQRQWDMHRHLVPVEVRVKRGTYQRVQLDGLALDQYWLKRLDTQAMQGRRPVQEHGMLADHLFQDVPDLRTLSFNQSLCSLDGGRLAA